MELRIMLIRSVNRAFGGCTPFFNVLNAQVMLNRIALHPTDVFCLSRGEKWAA
jgi:hypothetical protein